MRNSAVNEQASLVHKIGEIEHLVEVCRNHQELKTSIEGAALGGVLMIIVNELSQLHEAQQAKLDTMNDAGEEAVIGQGGVS